MHPVTRWLSESTRIPVVAAPLFIVSNPMLVAAQCKAGVIGSFPALNARPAELLDEWLFELEDDLAKARLDQPDSLVAPFAVNQIVHRSNGRLEADLEVIVQHRVPVVITSLGAREEVNEAVHSYGGIVLHDVINRRFAQKALEKGADGLIAVAAGAGGHAGSTSPFALVSEIREFFDGPLLLSGSISTGHALLAALALGADFGYVGSAFIATQEANAHPEYKEMLVAHSAEDIVYTSHFTGVKGNYLRPSVTRAGLDPDHLEERDPSTMSFADSGRAVKAWRDVWGSGQGIGAIKEIATVSAVVERLEREFVEAREELGKKVAAFDDAGDESELGGPSKRLRI
ncbi:MAG: nitronate monooxygenase family protein [Nitrospiraceae bacterium]|nr:nitronate monooxygenase family protein [Nitrospiraceae bacterium]MDA8262053.1 nitronate monooxygenase family protein [Actinomycetota bacterium]